MSLKVIKNTPIWKMLSVGHKLSNGRRLGGAQTDLTIMKGISSAAANRAKRKKVTLAGDKR